MSFGLLNIFGKSKPEVETEVVANLQVTVIVSRDATSEAEKQAIIEKMIKKMIKNLNADDVQVKGVKVFLKEEE